MRAASFTVAKMQIFKP